MGVYNLYEDFTLDIDAELYSPSFLLSQVFFVNYKRWCDSNVEKENLNQPNLNQPNLIAHHMLHTALNNLQEGLGLV